MDHCADSGGGEYLPFFESYSLTFIKIDLQVIENSEKKIQLTLHQQRYEDF